jgi:hypothetical protein
MSLAEAFHPRCLISGNTCEQCTAEAARSTGSRESVMSYLACVAVTLARQ